MDRWRDGRQRSTSSTAVLDTGVIIAAVIFLILHTPGNHEVFVSVDDIVSMREGEGGDKNKAFTGEARCMLNTNDGKFISVMETCQTVRDMIKQELKNLDGG